MRVTDGLLSRLWEAWAYTRAQYVVALSVKAMCTHPFSR